MVRVSRRNWGSADGKDIFLFDLACPGMSVSVSNYGAVLQSFEVEDARGNDLDIVLGYDTLGEYLSGRHFFGAMIGPLADRLEQGRCVLAGMTVQLPLNAGPDSMHSGPSGFHSQVWDWQTLPDGVLFRRAFPHLSLGFPGEMQVSLVYRLSSPFTLRMEYRAVCSRETALSFTNHSYFNLDGAQRDCRDHVLQVFSDAFAQTAREQDPLVTGRFLFVQGTPLDLRAGARIGDVITRNEHREIAAAGGIDHFYRGRGEGFRDMARLSSKRSGLGLTCRTDADGILVYTGNGLSDSAGKAGMTYGKHWAVCLETGQMPNAVNFQGFRERVVFAPGEEYRSVTEFAVTREVPSES